MIYILSSNQLFTPDLKANHKATDNDVSKWIYSTITHETVVKKADKESAPSLNSRMSEERFDVKILKTNENIRYLLFILLKV